MPIMNPGLCASAFAFFRDGELVMHGVRVLDGPKTNNFAEYTALLDLLGYLRAGRHCEVSIFSDSRLVVNQVNGVWVTRGDLLPLRRQAQQEMQGFGHKLFWVRGHGDSAGNLLVDKLCNQVLDEHQNKMVTDFTVSV